MIYCPKHGYTNWDECPFCWWTRITKDHKAVIGKLRKP